MNINTFYKNDPVPYKYNNIADLVFIGTSDLVIALPYIIYNMYSCYALVGKH